MCKGVLGTEELGRLQGALELEGKAGGRSHFAATVRHPSQSTGHSQPSACAHLSARVPGAFLLDPGPRGSQTSEGLH